MGIPSVPELLVIFFVILLLFGAKRIPEIARGLGKGIREFKDATREISSEMALDDDRPRVQQPRPPAQAPMPREPYEARAEQPEPRQASNPGGSQS